MLDPGPGILLVPAMNGALSLPNLITIGRIVAVPVICLLVVLGGPIWGWLGFILYVAAAASDWVDGYLARRLNMGSALGRMLDPIADKLLVGALLIVMAFTRDLGALDLIPAVAIMLREILVSGLREYLGPQNVTVHVTPLAKWKTTVQLVALGLVMLENLVPGLGLISDIVLWVAAVLTVWTGVQYYAGAWPHLIEESK
jgi:cardiolipin synthase (CMP-forming)